MSSNRGLIYCSFKLLNLIFDPTIIFRMKRKERFVKNLDQQLEDIELQKKALKKIIDGVKKINNKKKLNHDQGKIH